MNPNMKIILTICLCFISISSFGQFKADTLYSKKTIIKKLEPHNTKVLFEVDFGEPGIYKTFQTGYDKYNDLQYYSYQVNCFDYVITDDGEYYKFVVENPTYDKFKQIEDYVEVYFGEPISNFDKLSQENREDEDLYMAFQIDRDKEKIHRVYDTEFFRSGLVWDKEGLNLLVKPKF